MDDPINKDRMVYIAEMIAPFNAILYLFLVADVRDIAA
jgi:hypothetical protein